MQVFLKDLAEAGGEAWATEGDFEERYGSDDLKKAEAAGYVSILVGGPHDNQEGYELTESGRRLMNLPPKQSLLRSFLSLFGTLKSAKNS